MAIFCWMVRLSAMGMSKDQIESTVRLSFCEENSPLYTMDNVLLTPHMGWKGLETRQRLVSILADNIKKFMEGNPINVVPSL